MTYIGSQIFRPLPDIQRRITVCVPDVQTQLEVWLVHPLINIQKKPPIIIKYIFQHDFKFCFVFHKFLPEFGNLLRPIFFVVNIRVHARVKDNLLSAKVKPRLIALVESCHGSFPHHTVICTGVHIQKRTVKDQIPGSYLFHFLPVRFDRIRKLIQVIRNRKINALDPSSILFYQSLHVII